MPSRIVRSAVLQTYGTGAYKQNLDRQLALLERAAEAGVQIACLQELSTTPYFCQVQDKAWFKSAEAVPDGATVRAMGDFARRHAMVLIVPLFEIDSIGLFYNTAAVLDADGTYLGKYRKVHIPHNDGFYEKYYFRPGNLGFPVFETKHAKVGVYICYDRHFPEGARALGLAGAEVVFIPSATGGRSESQWSLEQRSLALANGYFVGTVNRVGREPLGPLEFFGRSYFADPLGEVLARGGAGEEIVTSDLDLSLIPKVREELTFLRDRRPETYGALTDSLEREAFHAPSEGDQ
jgi:beta-ureidopropionase